jgi:ABC-type polysaccharide/polyol phosphate transport system ATPase subunit
LPTLSTDPAESPSTGDRRPGQPAIRARGLVKTFQLTLHQGSLKALILSGGRLRRETVEALQGIDLDIHPGEAVALIGRNGSGKSTFLSLIGKIYLPTAGELQVNGRVAPLLELGAGFHPDLTGRENIELNGVILGLSRQQVAERTDSIIDFSEIRRFIDAPLRTYSSGMQVRLAFSVAIHTDSEIFIVDEALAVGDEEFQEKCFAQIDVVKSQGRTILFVSHEMTDVTRVATRAVWLDRGKIRMDARPDEVVEAYLRETHHLDG